MKTGQAPRREKLDRSTIWLTWSNPVRDLKEPTQVLRSNNETREEVVESNKDGTQNLGDSWGWNTSYKRLTKVGIDATSTSEQDEKGELPVIQQRKESQH